MNRYLTASALLLLAANPASGGTKIPWNSVGWYAISFGFGEDEEPGWLEVAAGPYPEERVCKIEADRRTAAEEDYMIVYFCKHLDRPPKPAGNGKIMIWIPD
jgi:hypothetical protein